MNDSSTELFSKLLETAITPVTDGYRSVLSGDVAENSSDPFWDDLIALYASSPAEDQALLLRLVQKVSIDTLSTVLVTLAAGSKAAGAPQEPHEGGVDEDAAGRLQRAFVAFLDENGL